VNRIPLISFATAFDLDLDDALARALSLGFRLDKHADPVEPGVRGLSLALAVGVAQQDPSLVAVQADRLAPGWGPLSEMGGDVLHSYPLEGGTVGVACEEGVWSLLHAEDGEPYGEGTYTDVEDALSAAEQVNVAASTVSGAPGADPSGSCGHDGGAGRKCLQPQGHKGPHYDGGESWPVAPEGRPLLTDDQLLRMVTAMEADGNLGWADTARHALSGDDAARRDCTTHVWSL